MIIQDILKQDIEAVRKELMKDFGLIKVNYKGTDSDVAKQYNVDTHDVNDTAKRPNKIVKKPTGTFDKDGNAQTQDVSQAVARILLKLQSLIVDRRAAFLIGDGIKLTSKADNPNQEALFEMVRQIWVGNKLDFRSRTIARILFKECEVAELWYLQEDMTFWQRLVAKLGLAQSKFSFRMKILANSLGDYLYPHFDEFGDMDAFSREYSIKDGEKVTSKYEIYTADSIYKFTKSDSGWLPDQGYPTKNPLQKIPVIYYYQPYPEWNDVQSLIDRLEKLLSNFADSNDYFGSPMIKVKGEVSGFAGKDDSGKVIQLTGEGADADYLTWDQAPEAIKLEIDTLLNMIYSLSQTPDISFSQLKSLGNTFTGVALKMLFMDAHLACMTKMETFGEMIQRRVNLIKAASGNVIAVKYTKDVDSLEIEPEFNFFMPQNDTETITNLTTATGNKAIMSQKTAVYQNPWVSDPAAELLQIQEEEKAANDALLAGSLNP